MSRGYWSTRDLCKRFRCTRCTINRWMKRETQPFPKPKIVATGSQNLWSIDDVQKWEIDCAIAESPELANQEEAA